MKFAKMQSAGNDYVVLESNALQHDWSQLAVTMCDRHFGIGADSLLLLLPSGEAHFQMRIFDRDGSEAEACGNGIRCLAKYAFEKGLVSAGIDQILVETIAGIRKIELRRRGDRIVDIQVSMGEPRFSADDIPAIIENKNQTVHTKSMLSYPVTVDGTDLLLHLVSMGNPHAVYFWQQPVSDFPLSRLGPKVEHLAIFPNRINFEVARVLNRKQIEVRVWERGVGETLACGTGACAVTVAAQLLGYIGKEVDIILPGGILKVGWKGVGEVSLSGPAEIAFTGEWPDNNT